MLTKAERIDALHKQIEAIRAEPDPWPREEIVRAPCDAKIFARAGRYNGGAIDLDHTVLELSHIESLLKDTNEDSFRTVLQIYHKEIPALIHLLRAWRDNKAPRKEI
jgi:hypothetical protein